MRFIVLSLLTTTFLLGCKDNSLGRLSTKKLSGTYSIIETMGDCPLCQPHEVTLTNTTREIKIGFNPLKLRKLKIFGMWIRIDKDGSFHHNYGDWQGINGSFFSKDSFKFNYYTSDAMTNTIHYGKGVKVED